MIAAQAGAAPPTLDLGGIINAINVTATGNLTFANMIVTNATTQNGLILKEPLPKIASSHRMALHCPERWLGGEDWQSAPMSSTCL